MNKLTDPNNTSPERAAFEAWFHASHTSANTRRGAKGYTSEVTRVAWRAWQARAVSPTGRAGAAQPAIQTIPPRSDEVRRLVAAWKGI